MNPSFSLIIEIQSGLVNAAIIGENGRVVETSSTSITGTPHRDSGHLLTAMSKALSETLHILTKKTHKLTGSGFIISRADCILSSPWIVSRTKSVKISYTKNVVVTHRLISTAIGAERRKISETIDKSDELTFVEQKIFEVKINGYPVVDFAGKTVRELDIFFAVSMSSEIILSRIREVIEKYAGHAAVEYLAYHSALLLGYAISRETNTDQENYIYAQIHGELSDVVVVKKGITAAMGSFPFGYGGLVRQTSKALGESELITCSKINLHSSRGLHREEENKVTKIIAPIAEERWAGEFLTLVNAAVAHGGSAEALPYRVFLSVPSDYYPHFKNALEAKSNQSLSDKMHTFFINHVNTHLIHTLLKL